MENRRHSLCGDDIRSNAQARNFPPSRSGAIIHGVLRTPNPAKHPSLFLVIDGELVAASQGATKRKAMELITVFILIGAVANAAPPAKGNDRLCEVPLDELFSSIKLEGDKTYQAKQVAKGSLWEKIGVKASDEILKINRQPLDPRNSSSLTFALNQSLTTQKLEVLVKRNAETKILKIRCPKS